MCTGQCSSCSTPPPVADENRLSVHDVRQSLQSHAEMKGRELREKYGAPGWEHLERILKDREFVRYPCHVTFDLEPLQPGEFGFPVPLGDRPEDGYRLCLHPSFAGRLEEAVWLALYQITVVNYGEHAAAADAEAFGAAALGLTTDAYYSQLCRWTDELSWKDSSITTANASILGTGSPSSPALRAPSPPSGMEERDGERHSSSLP